MCDLHLSHWCRNSHFKPGMRMSSVGSYDPLSTRKSYGPSVESVFFVKRELEYQVHSSSVLTRRTGDRCDRFWWFGQFWGGLWQTTDELPARERKCGVIRVWMRKGDVLFKSMMVVLYTTRECPLYVETEFYFSVKWESKKTNTVFPETK